MEGGSSKYTTLCFYCIIQYKQLLYGIIESNDAYVRAG